jgi:hypothetical protein
MTATRILWLSLMVACGGPVADAPKPATTPAPALTGERNAEGKLKGGPKGPPQVKPMGPPAPQVDPALLAQLRAMGAEGKAAIERCMAGVHPQLLAWKQGMPMGFDQAALDAACADVAAVHDRHEAALLPHFRSAHRALNALARVAEDARVIGIYLAHPERKETMATAVEHLKASLPEELAGIQEAVKQDAAEADMLVFPERQVDHAALVTELKRMVSNDETDLGNLVETFTNYAWAQRESHEMVRTRMLMHFGRWATALVASHRGELASLRPTDPADQAVIDAIGRYLDTANTLATVYMSGAQGFVDGTVAPGEADARLEAVKEAFETWQLARQAALASLG